MTPDAAPRLLIKMAPRVAQAMRDQRLAIGGNSFSVRDLGPNERPRVQAATAAPRWYLAESFGNDASAADLWDAAYEAMRTPGSPLANGGVQFIEPDLAHDWLYENRVSAGRGLGAASGELCGYNDQFT